jgi:hypothetical protein
MASHARTSVFTVNIVNRARGDTAGSEALRQWLLADAVITGVNAIAYVALATWLTDLLGPDARTLRIIGAGLLVFTGVVGWAVMSGSRSLARGVVAVNALWVVGSLLLAATGALDLTAAGTVWAVAQALVVGLLAGLQAQALRAAGGASCVAGRLSSPRPPARSVAGSTTCSSNAAWTPDRSPGPACPASTGRPECAGARAAQLRGVRRPRVGRRCLGLN